MDKYTIPQLAEILIRKNGLSEEEAQSFVSAIFDLIKEGLEADKIVKVKGFGTFKIIDVDPRESVNVNTGERVLINGHQKITFTPDSVMKEMVNRPFSQFETVILNDGVDFNDVEVEEKPTSDTEEATVEEKEEDSAPIEEEQEKESAPIEEVKEESPEEEEKTEEMPKEEEKSPEEDISSEAEVSPEAEVSHEVEVSPEEEISPEVEDSSEEIEEETEHHYTAHIIGSIVCLILIAAAAYGGYVFGVEEGRHQERLAQIAEQSAYLDKQKEEIVAYKAKAKADTAANKAKTKTDTTVVKKPKENPAAEQSQESMDFSTYAMRDVRVRTGAYVIIGIDKVVTAHEGQTVGKIAKSHLGPGMSCYVEVVNGMNENDPLKEGTKVKIPKLRHKKAKK
ncbi:MAG: HU family DNA-binding protein [Prevotella sp.]